MNQIMNVEMLGNKMGAKSVKLHCFFFFFFFFQTGFKNGGKKCKIAFFYLFVCFLFFNLI